jgi:phosphotransferase system  glucose/maltose/N-acetylglucosamine-specific IIC component
MDSDMSKINQQQVERLLERSISHMAEIFVPLLPAIITGGLILGFRNVICDIRMFDGKTLAEVSQFGAALHSFLWQPGEAIFLFLPVGVCWATVKKLGGTPILGIVQGIIWISKKENEREITVPAAISAYLGVTEPAMYGVNLKYKFPMLCAMIGSALAAAICGSAA